MRERGKEDNKSWRFFHSGLSHISPLEGIIDLKMSQKVRWKCQREKKKDKRVHNSLAEFFRFNEDVEVGFFELLCEHAEDIRGGREISQVVNDQVEQQLKRDMERKTDRQDEESPSLSCIKTIQTHLCVFVSRINMWLCMPDIMSS